MKLFILFDSSIDSSFGSAFPSKFQQQLFRFSSFMHSHNVLAKDGQHPTPYFQQQLLWFSLSIQNPFCYLFTSIIRLVFLFHPQHFWFYFSIHSLNQVPPKAHLVLPFLQHPTPSFYSHGFLWSSSSIQASLFFIFHSQLWF